MDDRRALIADAALRVIAREGIRGLTHRAADREAALPDGSTSYYCRRRVDLQRLAMQRIFDLDAADLDALRGRIARARKPVTAVDLAADLVHDWLTDGRERTVARFELFLAASHEPELQSIQLELTGQVTALARDIHPAGPPLGARRTLALMQLAEGLMLRVLRHGLPCPPRAELVATLSTVLPAD